MAENLADGNTMETAPRPRTIRNPSPEELGANDPKTVEALPVAAAEPIVEAKSKLKKATSRFEPKAIPFRIPSRGRTFTESELEPVDAVMLRRMTAVDEAAYIKIMRESSLSKDTSRTMDFMHAITAVIDGCLRSDVSVYRLPLIDKLPIFIEIFALTYGRDHKVEYKCEECGGVFEHPTKLSQDLALTYVPDDFKFPRVIELTDFDFPIRAWFTIPTIGDEDAFFGAGADIVKQIQALLYRAEGTMPDGTPVTADDYSEIAEMSGQSDRKKVRDFMDEVGAYGTDVTVSKKICKDKKCEAFGKKVQAKFPMEYIFGKMLGA